MTEATHDTGSSIAGLIDGLAGELGRSVVINDSVVRMLYASRHYGDEDELRIRAVLQHDAGREASAYVLDHGVARWSHLGMIEANPALGMHARLCVPLLSHAGVLLGLLMVIDAERTLTPSEITRIEDVSRTASALLQQERAAGDQDRRARETTLMALLGPEAGARRAARKAGIGGGWLPDGRYAAVVAVEVRASAITDAEAETALRTVVESSTRRLPGRMTGAVDGRRGVLLHSGAHLDPADGDAEAARMVAALDRLLPERDVAVAGVGDIVAGTDEAWISHDHAVVACRGGRLIPGSRPVLAWSELGPYAILLQLDSAAARATLIPDPIARLRADDRAARLVETLRVFLDSGGSMPRTAQILHLHRTSLYYRLDQIREITRLDLDDGRNRLLLHLGLLLAELLPDQR